MALKTYKATNNASRQLVGIDRSELHKGAPVKALTEGKIYAIIFLSMRE